jgi:hypothetical protein
MAVVTGSDDDATSPVAVGAGASGVITSGVGRAATRCGVTGGGGSPLTRARPAPAAPTKIKLPRAR